MFNELKKWKKLYVFMKKGDVLEVMCLYADFFFFKKNGFILVAPFLMLSLVNIYNLSYFLQ